MSSNDTPLTYNVEQKVNPLRPYYTPGLHRQHNYTSLPSNDTIPGTTPEIFEDDLHHPFKKTTSHTLSYALMRYIVTMINSPFEVGTTLLQVQYSPHKDVEVFAEQTQWKEQVTNTNYASSDEDEEDGFYTMQPKNSPIKASGSQSVIYNDHLMGISVYDTKKRPKYQMAPMHGGVLEILNQILKHPSEGWRSLFKGQRIRWIHDMLRTVLQTMCENQLNDIFGLYDDTIPLIHLDNVTGNLTTTLASHILVGLLLSPLEILHTRMIVQSSATSDGTYEGLYSGWKSLLKDEGGLMNIYTSAKNYWPTILYYSLTPLVNHFGPIFIDRTFHISAADNPIVYSAATFGLSTIALILTMPLETIRKRLQCQIGTYRASPKKKQVIQNNDKNDSHEQVTTTTNNIQPYTFQTTVPLRPIHYSGILDALYKIMKEEGAIDYRTTASPSLTSAPSTSSITNTESNTSLKYSPHLMTYSSDEDEQDDMNHYNQYSNVSVGSKKLTSAWGVRGLYKGFGIQLAANVMMFVIHTVNGLDDDFDGLF
ncbi:mitochondrial carrier domain-containing protein [Cunninghamella echinulata]|nr:mitochondrial carrier domain-containing protein [Cunninghamella echinulata]